MKVSFVRTKPEEPRKVAFGDLEPGDRFRFMAEGSICKKYSFKVKDIYGYDGTPYLYDDVTDDRIIIPINQPELPKPSWDDFRYGCVAKALDNYNREVIIHYAFHGERVFYRDGQGATWDTRTAHKSYTLLELYPPGSGYLKIEI